MVTLKIKLFLKLRVFFDKRSAGVFNNCYTDETSSTDFGRFGSDPRQIFRTKSRQYDEGDDRMTSYHYDWSASSRSSVCPSRKIRVYRRRSRAAHTNLTEELSRDRSADIEVYTRSLESRLHRQAPTAAQKFAVEIRTRNIIIWIPNRIYIILYACATCVCVCVCMCVRSVRFKQICMVHELLPGIFSFVIFSTFFGLVNSRNVHT